MDLVFRTNPIHRNVWVMLLFRKSIILLKRNSGCLSERMACGLQDWKCDLIHRSFIDKFCWWGRSPKCSLLSFNFLSVRWICALCSLPHLYFVHLGPNCVCWLSFLSQRQIGWRIILELAEIWVGGVKGLHIAVTLSLQPSCRSLNSSGFLLHEGTHPMAEVMLPNVQNLQFFV